MKKFLRITSIVLVSLILLSSCSAVNDLSVVKETGDAFMAALKAGDNETSWNLLTEDVQAEIGGRAAWVDFVIPRTFQTWKFTSTEVNDDQAQLDGEATLGADTYTVVLVLAKVDDLWKLSGINFTYKE
jgi:hypothetical protein